MGPYENCPIVWGGPKNNPVSFFKKSNNCEIIINPDSVIALQKYSSYIENLSSVECIENLFGNIPGIRVCIKIKVRPGGYLPIAGNKHIILNSKKRTHYHYTFLNPMKMIVNSDTLILNTGLEINPPLQLQPKKYKELNGMPVIVEYK